MSLLDIAGGKSQQFTILNIDTIFNFYKPKPPLSKYVDNLWLFEGYEPGHKTERILPTGTLELVINLRRRFIQVFKAEVGITPKLFSRIQRFQQTRTFIQHNPSINWADLAVDFGYFDQSHFIREFLEFSGLSPTDYINRQKRFIEPNIHVER